MLWASLSYSCGTVLSVLTQNMKRDVELSRSQREEEVVARKEVEATLRNTRKEMEAQELVRG